MSRDFTPQMHYLVSKEYPEIYSGNFIIHIEGKPDRKMFTDEQMQLKEKYKTFYICAADIFFKIYEKYSTEKFEKINNLIESLVEATDTSSFPNELVEWFEGKLDKNFYYHERNDELFLEWLDTFLSS